MDKNYYMDEPMTDSGISQVYNPSKLQDTALHFSDYQIPETYAPSAGDLIDSHSRYDEELGDIWNAMEEGLTIEDLRARKQSAFNRLGNALVNNLAIAGTTAVSGTLGFIDGLFEAASTQEENKIWNNDLNQTMSDWQEYVRERFPIYRGPEYQNKSIWQKMGSGIFWADLIQNLGYSEGMMIPGGLTALAMAGAPAFLAAAIPSIVGAVGEASMEAINSKNDEVNNKIAIANQEYNRMASQIQSPEELENLDLKYRETLDNIENDSIKAGNFVFGSNMALLTLSNLLEFGNIFSRGFSTAKRLKGALRRKGSEFLASSMPLEIAKTAGKKTLDAFMEGMEEVSQKAISDTPMNYTDYNSFNESMFNPEKRELVGNLWKSLGTTYAETLHDKDTAEEFMSGFLIGALGVPTMKRGKHGIPYPILANNAASEIYEKYKQVRKAQQQADEINTRLQDNEKINSYYNGIVRHLAIQDKMNTSIDNDDAYEYKTAESAQFINDIDMFDDAGDIDYLKSLVNSAVDMSDEGIISLIKETTKDGEGPFIQNGNPMDIESVRRILQERVQTLNSKIDNYLNDKQLLEQTFPNIDKETLKNAIFLKQQLKDHTNRYNSLIDELYEGINKLNKSFISKPKKESSKKGKYIFVKTPEGKRKRVLKDSIDYFDENGLPIFKSSTENESENQDLFSSKEQFKKTIFDPAGRLFVEAMLNDNEDFSMSFDEKEALKTKLQDIDRLKNNLVKMNLSLGEILINPIKSKEDADKIKEKKVNEKIRQQSNELKVKLQTATTLPEFKDIIESEEDASIKESALQELDNEGNAMAHNYRKITSYESEVIRTLHDSEEENEVKSDALTLLSNQIKNATNLSEATNTGSIFLNDDSILQDNNLTAEENFSRFQKAQNALIKAMEQVNNNNKFKDEILKNYQPEEKEGMPNPNTPEKKSTGNSNTAVVPPVNGQEAFVSEEEEDDVIGDISNTQLIEENKQIDSQTESSEDFDMKFKGSKAYYRPAIPELDKDNSQKGDYRPFDEVAKEKKKGNFSTIYKYLKEQGVFDFVNKGKLKSGEPLYFTIDPEFEKLVEGESWHTEPVIFITTKDGQIVGNLQSSDTESYEGLPELRKRIVDEYNKNKNTDKKFVATPTTKVSKIMSGRIPLGIEERNLSDIPNVRNEGKSPVFGIVKDRTIVTNGKIDSNQIVPLKSIKNKDGQMYLLVPNSEGKYVPMNVRVKHFNFKEFNPNDIKVQNTATFKKIKEITDKMAQAQEETEISQLISDLKELLYFGNKKNRTSYVEWFSSDKGNGLRFTKITRDKFGNRIGKDKESVVYFNDIQGNQKSINTISDEIIKNLLEQDLLLRVSANKINQGTYNDELIDSNILTSNILDARVIGSWFTTDYFDSSGNLHSAVNPRSSSFNAGTTASVTNGIKITIIGGNTYNVDIENGAIYDDNNQRIYPSNFQLLLDLAWAESVFGNAKNSSLMWNNMVLLPSGQVLDRTTQEYLPQKEAKVIIDRLTGVKKSTDNSKILFQIAENQKRVDRDKTDSEYYYILEDDGQYHQYERVHKRLGSNWIESPKQKEELRKIQVKLSQLANNPAQYAKYITSLENYWKVNLDKYRDSVDVKSREAIINTIRDYMANTKSQRAVDAGNSVHTVIAQFFTSNETPVKPENMSEQAFIKLISDLTELRTNLEARGERFLTNNIVLFQKYNDGTRIAGEVDILSIDKDGNFRIYDVKTKGRSFHDFINKYGQKVNYFKNKYVSQIMSDEAYYTLQLSAYKNLFESQYHAPVTTLALLPFVMGYDESDNISTITKEKGILIKYNPAVNVPSTNATKIDDSTDTVTPIFNSALEIKNPIDSLSKDFAMEGSKIGYFIRDGKLYKGYLMPLGQINGIELYMTKVPNYLEGHGSSGVINNNYWMVFPNGKTVEVTKNTPYSKSDEVMKKELLKVAENSDPQKVFSLANEKTDIFNPSDIPAEKTEEKTPSNIFNNNNTPGAFKDSEANNEVNKLDSEIDDNIDINDNPDNDKRFRKTDTKRKIWNKENELKWLKKVLPQLSEQDRVRVVKGLIPVAQSGEYAWGQLKDGIIVLSDMAAEGTSYHEAFHAVFNLLLNSQERQNLLQEAKEKFGDKSDIELEEDMAEAFREYVMNRENRGLGRRIIDFFKELLAKITNWKYLQPSLDNYFRMIDEGKFADSNLSNSLISMQKILDNAPRDSEGRLLAPNGKVSNLTERQYAQVRTKDFINWYGDWINHPESASKVLDENGEPLVAYHAGNASINTFKSTITRNIQRLKSSVPTDDIKLWRLQGYLISDSDAEKYANGEIITIRKPNAIYTTDDIDMSLSYIVRRLHPKDNGKEVTGDQYALFVNLKNPLIIDAKGSSWNNIRYNGTIHTTRALETLARNKGYDGVIIHNVIDYGSRMPEFSPNTVYESFSSNQIKSATDNIGTFSKTDDDIRYRKEDNTTISLQELKSSNKNKNLLFNSLESEVKKDLMDKGWTEEKFNSISQEEREQAIECITL